MQLKKKNAIKDHELQTPSRGKEGDYLINIRHFIV